ncbi:hypothetical protein TA3x_004641 [Tundrisphaera sp. TA3]|uniref:hypothetical protein n=1 Tax=Tundrisphaera sp. TA3 TaxID=3435775 RepID=UPI003EC0EBA2
MMYPRRPLKRRVLIAAMIASAILLAFVLALPSLLSTRAAKSRIVGKINQVLAPGFLEVGALQLGWSGPIRLERVTLLDPKGAVVVATPSATLDRGLWHLWTGGLRGATLTLADAALDIERSADGTINLGRALASLIEHPDPRRDLTIKITRGTLRYRDPDLTVPATADRVQLSLRLPAAPDPITGTLSLELGDASLVAGGSLDRWKTTGDRGGLPEIRLDLRGRRWPFAVRSGGVDLSGHFDGSVDVIRRRDLWHLLGDTQLLGVAVRGDALHGDVLDLDRVDAGWDLEQASEGWAIRRLDVTGGFGDLKAEGSLDPNGRKRITGRLDLAAIAAQIPRTLGLREGLVLERGTARLEMDATPGPEGMIWDAEARLGDLAGHDGDRQLSIRDSASLSASLTVLRPRSTADQWARLDRIGIKTPFLEMSGRAQNVIDETSPTTRPIGFDSMALEGSADLGELHRQLGQWVDLGDYGFAGHAEVKGHLRFEHKGLDANLEAKIGNLRVDGLLASPIRRDDVTVEGRIDARLEDGWQIRQAHLAVSSAGESASFMLPASDEGSPQGLPSRRMSAHVSIPIDAGNRSARCDVDLQAVWLADRQALDIAPVSLVVDRGDRSAPLSVVAVGRYEHDEGTLRLRPGPDTPHPNWIGLAPEGMTISGIGRGLAHLHASANLVGHLAGRSGQPSSGTGPDRQWSGLVEIEGDGTGVDLAAKFALGSPGATFSRATTAMVQGRFNPQADRIELAEVTLASAFGVLDASGRVEDLSTRRRFDLKGSIAPDVAAMNAWLEANVESGAKVAGRGRPFQVSGSFERGWPSDLEGDLGLDLESADVYGMKLGPAAVLMHARAGRMSVEPISTTLNQGHLRLEPELDWEGPDGPSLRFGKNSTIRDARINDEVSRRVLAFVAPVLEGATTATGRVSVDLDHAEIPLLAGRAKATRLEGEVEFADVEFTPGPLADQLIRATGRQETRLRLDQPITLTIADGRVNQRGLAIPIGELSRVEIEGWVGFDRSLSLTAILPMTPAMFGEYAMLADIAGGTRVSLPIRGNLDRPELDREALAAHLKDLGQSLITRGATRGAIELLKGLARPRDTAEDAPEPRPSPEERKARRMERKAQRRGLAPP